MLLSVALIASNKSLSMANIDRIQKFATTSKYFNLFCYVKKCSLFKYIIH